MVSPAHRSRRWRASLIGIFPFCSVLALAACRNAAPPFLDVALGGTQETVLSRLPVNASRSTHLGFTSFESGPTRSDAVVLLLTPDRRVCARFHAVVTTARDGAFASAAPGYRLVGEITSEFDGLRAGADSVAATICGRLLEYQGEALAVAAHRSVAIGLMRWLQVWPGARDLGAAPRGVGDLWQRVPGGGRALMQVDSDGTVRLEYSVSG